MNAVIFLNVPSLTLDTKSWIKSYSLLAMKYDYELSF